MTSFEIELVGDVAVVRLAGSPANSQGEGFYESLHATLDRLDDELSGRAVVLTARGGTFSAGLDLPYVSALFETGDRDELRAWQARYFATNLRLFAFERPLICAINGHAYAGGLITALCADLRICVDRGARLTLNEVPIGIPMPGVYLELIAHAVTWPVASRLSLFGEVLDPSAALELGVVDRLAAPDALLATAIEIASSISPDTLDAFAQTKRMTRAPALERMRANAREHDLAALDVVSDAASVRALRRRLDALAPSAK